MAGLGHRQDRGVMLPPLDEIDGFMVRPGFYNSEGAVPTARGCLLYTSCILPDVLPKE